MGDGAARADLRRLVPSFHVFDLLLCCVVLVVLRREGLGASHLVSGCLLDTLDLLPEVPQLLVGELGLEGLVLEERLKVDCLPVPDFSALLVDVDEAVDIAPVRRLLLLPVLLLPSDNEPLISGLLLLFFVFMLFGLLVEAFHQGYRWHDRVGIIYQEEVLLLVVEDLVGASPWLVQHEEL